MELDQPLTLKEVQLAVKNLSKGKAAGIDGIMNEVFMFGGDATMDKLHLLFDRVFQGEVFPTQWSQGLIYPLFKGEPAEYKFDPNKYRGITLLSVVGKIFTAVLNRRLTDFVESHGIQSCFRSTVDQIYI